MIESENAIIASHQNLSDFNQFLFKKRYEVIKKENVSSENIRNLGNCMYDYYRSFVVRIVIQSAMRVLI